MEGYGVDTSLLPERQTYDAMIKIATHEMSRSDLAGYFRSTLARERTSDATQRLTPPTGTEEPTA
jgi:hypothetical protein